MTKIRMTIYDAAPNTGLLTLTAMADIELQEDEILNDQGFVEAMHSLLHGSFGEGCRLVLERIEE